MNAADINLNYPERSRAKVRGQNARGIEMNNRQTRALCYAAMFILVSIDWTMIGGALFLTLMDFVTAPEQQTEMQ